MTHLINTCKDSHLNLSIITKNITELTHNFRVKLCLRNIHETTFKTTQNYDHKTF